MRSFTGGPVPGPEAPPKPDERRLAADRVVLPRRRGRVDARAPLLVRGRARDLRPRRASRAAARLRPPFARRRRRPRCSGCATRTSSGTTAASSSCSGTPRRPFAAGAEHLHAGGSAGRLGRALLRGPRHGRRQGRLSHGDRAAIDARLRISLEGWAFFAYTFALPVSGVVTVREDGSSPASGIAGFDENRPAFYLRSSYEPSGAVGVPREKLRAGSGVVRVDDEMRSAPRGRRRARGLGLVPRSDVHVRGRALARRRSSPACACAPSPRTLPGRGARGVRRARRGSRRCRALAEPDLGCAVRCRCISSHPAAIAAHATAKARRDVARRAEHRERGRREERHGDPIESTLARIFGTDRVTGGTCSAASARSRSIPTRVPAPGPPSFARAPRGAPAWPPRDGRAAGGRARRPRR